MANLVLKAILGGDGSGFELMMKRAESSVHKLEHEMSGFAKEKVAELFGVVAMEEGIRRAAEYAHKIATVSKQMGISTDEAQQLDYQMSDTTGSIEAAAGAFKKLKLAQAEVLNGSQEFRRYFSTMGISAEDAANSSAADLYKRIGKHVGAMPDELTPTQQVALQKLMGKGADSLIPSFKMGQRQLPPEMIIPGATIEKMHGYRSGFSDSGVKMRKMFSEATAFTVESLFSTGVLRKLSDPEGRKQEARDYVQGRVETWGWAKALRGRASGARKGIPEGWGGLMPAGAPPLSNAIDVAGLNASQQAEAANNLTEVFKAARLLSTRGRPQIRRDVEEIGTLRMRASAIEDDGSNPANNAEAATLRFQAYQRVRSLINPFPDRLSLNSLQSAGLQRINGPEQNLGRNILRLATVMDQLVVELRRQGIVVPRYSDINYR